jgi:hypothetical protein
VVVALRGRRNRRGALLGVLFLLVALGLSAQETSGTTAAGQSPDAEPQARRILVMLSFAPESDYSPQEAVLLRESLMASLSARQEYLSVVEWPEADFPETDRERTFAAFDLGCDSWLAVTVTGSVEEAAYQALAFDLVARKYPVEYEMSLSQPLRTRDLQQRFWAEMTEELSLSMSVPESGTEITFVGEPGTVIVGAGDTEIALGETGRTTVVLPNPNVYRFRATRINYDPLTETLVVGDDPQTVVLDQQPAPRHIVDLGLSTLNFPTASYGYYLLPNYIFAKIGVTSYVAGFYLLSETGEERRLFVSEPLTEIHLQAGSYFTPADRDVRGYAGAIGGMRIIHSVFFLGLEPIAPFYAGPFVGFEFEPVAKILGFFEWSPVMLFTEVPTLLGSSVPAGYDPMGVTDFGIGLVEFLRYRVGVRYQW